MKREVKWGYTLSDQNNLSSLRATSLSINKPDLVEIGIVSPRKPKKHMIRATGLMNI